jgi:hypothetical protein
MSDLYNDFPNWGESGEYPPNGFFYEGGDQVNEKHLDALWDGIDDHITNLNDAIRDRVLDLHGNVVLDTGLDASQGGGTLEVDVTASDGAYVDGQRVDGIIASTTTHSANSSGSQRTDVVYLTTNGSVEKNENTNSAPSGTLKIAEVDVATNDTIAAIRNYARDHADHVATETEPSNPEVGDLWLDESTDVLKVYVAGSWESLLKTDLSGESLTLTDTGSNPTVNGELTNNNGDVVVQTGGTDLNLSNVGTSSYTDEDAQDAVGTIMTGSGATSVNYDDGGNTITISSTDTDTTYNSGDGISFSSGPTISVDESYSFVWSSQHSFSDSVFFNGNKSITDSNGDLAIQDDSQNNIATFGTESQELIGQLGLTNTSGGGTGVLYTDSNGDVIVEDASGNSTTLT